MNRYLRAEWGLMERAGKLDLSQNTVKQMSEREKYRAICGICERFLLAGAQLPEEEALGWQLELNNVKNHLFSNSPAVIREDLNWIFRPMGVVGNFGRRRTGREDAQHKERSLYVISSAEGSMKDSARFRSNYGYDDDFFLDDEILATPDKEEVFELFEMLSASDAVIRLMAGSVSEGDPGNGMILVSLRGEMSLRLKTLLSQVFPHLAAVDPSAVDPEEQHSLCLPNKYFLNTMTVILKTVLQLTEKKPLRKAAGNRKKRSAGKTDQKEEDDPSSGRDDISDLIRRLTASLKNLADSLAEQGRSEDPDIPEYSADYPAPDNSSAPEEPIYPPEGKTSDKDGGFGEGLLPNPAYADDETSIDEFSFSVRTYNALKRAGIITVGKLAQCSMEELAGLRNMGRKSLQEILEEFGNYINNSGHRPCPEKRSGSISAEKKSGLDRLDELIGLAEVKKQLKKIAALARLKKDMKEQGREAGTFSLNMEFIGNPGTAKTTVARIVAGLFHEAGLLTSDDFVEVGRSALIARYEGQTADEVRRVFDMADGKVLFIDEAYSLLEGHEGDYGDEAINTIVQEMENRRDRTVVIFAGYPDKMEAFFKRNPGLRSRVPFTLCFDDYSAEELAEIAGTEANRRGFAISEEASAALQEACLYASTHPELGNGRFVRNLVENAIMSYAERVYRETELTQEEGQRDFTLIASDFTLQYKKTKAERRPLGFLPEKKAG